MLSLFNLSSCSPFQASEIYYKRDALYNFLEEGFLSADILQAAGRSQFKSSDGTTHSIRMSCLNRATDMAHDRLVSMMLHTKLSIRNRSASTRGDFQADYPHQFTDREILLASIDFAPLLNQSFTTFQDFSDNGSCLVVVRIIKDDISKSIRSFQLSFALDY